MAPSSAFSQGSAPIQRNKAAEVNAQANHGQPHQPEIAFSMAQLWDGTAFIAQTAVVTFSLSLSGRLLARPLTLFSWHPLSQLLGLFLLLQSVLVLQPTRTAGQKRVGQTVHAALNFASFTAFAAGFCAIYLNKERNAAAAAGAGAASVVAHFTTLHGALGATLTAMLAGQHVAGLTMWAVPALYGGEARARSVWKLHRVSGYVSLLLLLATFGTAAGTGFVRNALKIESWVFYVPMALIAVGVLPRIHASKLGFSTKKA